MVPLSPFHQVFAVGDILLIGTQRKFPINWVTITGFVFLSVIQYLFFAPVYWFYLMRNVRKLRAESVREQGKSEDAVDVGTKE